MDVWCVGRKQSTAMQPTVSWKRTRAIDGSAEFDILGLSQKGTSIDQADDVKVEKRHSIGPLHTDTWKSFVFWWTLVPVWYLLTKTDKQPKILQPRKDAGCCIVFGRAQLRLSVAKELTGNKIDQALATLSRVIPRTGCQNATVLVYRAVAYICVGKKERAWDARACIDLGKSDVYATMGDLLHRMNRLDDALEVLTKGLESTDTESECIVAMQHVEMSKRVAVAFDASMTEIIKRLIKGNPAMLERLTVPDNRNRLQEVKSFPYKFKETQARMEEVLQILEDDPPAQTTKVSHTISGALKTLEDALKQDHPIQISPEPPGTSYSELDVALSSLRTASQDDIIRVLKPEFMTPHLARNPDTVLFLGNSEFHQMLLKTMLTNSPNT
ncbi:Aste57867_4859 [Aphanomyces stellatus]|uniref:Aste57867_4859 protein n=1 Tax=Aphanomyces stellatus TaxID=120398 RepID=A0A485KEK4_9STRA|nr:hypothetical protein As57867_004846 [Aphanomyces stellatus]VFT81952.1 Aste57867_4859 [Aphanomyces stellatus]